MQISPTFFYLSMVFYGLRSCSLDTLERWLYFRKTNTIPPLPPPKKKEKKKKDPTSRLAFFLSTRWKGNAFFFFYLRVAYALHVCIRGNQRQPLRLSMNRPQSMSTGMPHKSKELTILSHHSRLDQIKIFRRTIYSFMMTRNMHNSTIMRTLQHI